MKHWSRLVRFNAQGHGDKVFLGQPVDPKVDGTLYYIFFGTISDILVFSSWTRPSFWQAGRSLPDLGDQRSRHKRHGHLQ